MHDLMPPSPGTLVRNARLLADDWRASGALARYFMASQVLSMVLMTLCACASAAAIVVDDLDAYLRLLAASALCLAHTMGTWQVLRRRFFVRYELL
jgi:hypothetical protein